MDKSFNDDELSDIMKEIEALEEDFSSPQSFEESAHNKTIPIASSPEENVISLGAGKSASSAVSSSSTSMSFKVQGNITLDLSFDIGGKVVSLGVTDQGLTIEMDGGIKFSVPVPSVAKKAA